MVGVVGVVDVGLLGDPGTSGVGGDAGGVHAAAPVLDRNEHVESMEEGGVDVGDVDREDRVGLRRQVVRVFVLSPLARMTTPEAPSITSCIPESLRSTRTSRRPPRCGTVISAGRSTRTSQAPSAHAARSVPSAAVGGGVVVTGAGVQALGPHPAIEFDAGKKRTHDYVRHGTTNLFAALNVTTGEVFGECKPTRNGANFLAFLKKAVKPHSDAEIHVVLDNLSTHTTPDVMAWLERNPHVYFHFTPARVNRSSARPMSSLDRPADHGSAPARVRPAGRPHPPARRWSRGRGEASVREPSGPRALSWPVRSAAPRRP